MNGQSAVSFPGKSRVHIALAVTDLQRSRAFYETLLGVSPTKERPGYVKFEPQNPSVNLTLNEVDTEPVPPAKIVIIPFLLKLQRLLVSLNITFSKNSDQ